MRNTYGNSLLWEAIDKGRVKVGVGLQELGVKIHGLTFLSVPSSMSAPLKICKCALEKPAGNT